ncbi:hypothetical protein Slin15195_G098500 [Septoria linicola]|uniref:Uncharacterized protein n=1 Tax=Septoria linicola TaxID=215465 RepID=A0A9Q9B559_9PEZI|nr:hypothetical protein Slin14017_G061560 [Septoria linicola]USW56531.1 hypothetical protein Slin15195_G098500 [Septoria linicola]
MNYDSELAPVTGMPFARDQIFANAVALYPHLIKDAAKAQRISSTQVDPKEVFQILTIHENSSWTAVLVHGVPRVEATLARGSPVWSMAESINRLLKATGEMLNMRLRDELHISSRSITKVSGFGQFNMKFL